MTPTPTTGPGTTRTGAENNRKDRAMTTFRISMLLSVITMAATIVVLRLLGITGVEGAAWFLGMGAATGWASFLTLATMGRPVA
jgi:hypothetical protein